MTRTPRGPSSTAAVRTSDREGTPPPRILRDDGTRPSIAVLPFRLLGAESPYATIADALPDELIAELSRLRWLFVIARGSSFRFRSAAPDLVDQVLENGLRGFLKKRR